MILVDTGPLVALVSADDQHHRECAAAFRTLRKPMGTVWPVLAEAMHLLGSLSKAQDNVWEMIVRGVVQLLPLGPDDVPRIRELMHKYSDPNGPRRRSVDPGCGAGRRPPVLHDRSERFLSLPAPRQDSTGYPAVVEVM
jgi:hypothetical protein